MRAKIKAKHPEILERGPNGLYRYMLAAPDLREALYDYLACDRVASAWARKRPAKDADLDRLSKRSRRTDMPMRAAPWSSHCCSRLREMSSP